jgi:hypothetical protein
VITTKVVLFGAGASFGSLGIYPHPPPLGRHLYSRLKIEFPQTWGKLPKNFHEIFDKNFEKGMLSLFKTTEFSLIIPSLMRDMAEYFCNFIPICHENLYIKFLAELKDSIIDIVFSSLNYDLIFENAAIQNQLATPSFERNDNTPYLLKLHGSCNFLPIGLTVKDIGFAGGPAPMINMNIKASSTEEVKRFCHDPGQALYPAMCLYMKSKVAQFGYNVILELQKKWTNEILNAEKVLIIGVKPYPEDRYIWDPLSQTNAILGYIGNKNDFEYWKEAFRKDKNSELLGLRWDIDFSKSVDFLLS